MALWEWLMRLFSDTFFRNFIKNDRCLYLVEGLWVSLEITLIAAVMGCALGLLLAVCKIYLKKGPLRSFADGYIAIIRGTPTTVQLVFIYFVIFGSVDISRVLVASVAFGLNSAAYVAEIVRAGIQAVDKGQMEAARSIGLSYFKTMRFVIVPQAIKNILPALGNEFIVLLKETSIAGYIGINDLTRGGTLIRNQTFDPFAPLLAVAYTYFLLTALLSFGLTQMERRLHKGD